MGKHNLSQMLQEVRREIRKRHEVYPGLVRKRVMRQGEADEMIATMRSVEEALVWMIQNEHELPDGCPWQRALI
jgi:hypothetical protein